MNDNLTDTGLLKKTFDLMNAVSNPLHPDSNEKITKIHALVSDRFDEAFCRRAFNIIHSQYRILPDRNPAMLKARIKTLFKGEVNDDETGRILNLVVFNLEEISPETDFLAEMSIANMGLAGEPQNHDVVDNPVGRFGLDPGNPIPVNGISMINSYFQRLRLLTGDHIIPKRSGSVKAENLPNLVDKYLIYDADNVLIATLYIYAYHGSMSDKAPEGFRLL